MKYLIRINILIIILSVIAGCSSLGIDDPGIEDVETLISETSDITLDMLIETGESNRGIIIEEYQVVLAIINVVGPDGISQQRIWEIGDSNRIRFVLRQPGLYTITITQTDEADHTSVVSYTMNFESSNCYSILIRLGGVATVTIHDEVSLGEMVIE